MQITSNIDEKTLRSFRDIIYRRYGLKKGDFKKALEEAMIDFVRKYGAEKEIL